MASFAVKRARWGILNGRKVADWLSEVTGTKISRYRMGDITADDFYYEYRPSHTESDPLEQEAWKKLAIEVKELKALPRCRNSTLVMNIAWDSSRLFDEFMFPKAKHQ